MDSEETSRITAHEDNDRSSGSVAVVMYFLLTGIKTYSQKDCFITMNVSSFRNICSVFNLNGRAMQCKADESTVVGVYHGEQHKI